MANGIISITCDRPKIIKPATDFKSIGNRLKLSKMATDFETIGDQPKLTKVVADLKPADDQIEPTMMGASSKSKDDQIKLTQFTCFSALPKNLRRKIWMAAIDRADPRIVSLQFVSELPATPNNLSAMAFAENPPNPLTVELAAVGDKLSAVPSMLHTNREARKIASEFYKPLLQPLYDYKTIFFHFGKDILHVTDWISMNRLLTPVTGGAKPIFWRPPYSTRSIERVTRTFPPVVQDSVRHFWNNIENLIVCGELDLQDNFAQQWYTPTQFPRLQTLVLQVPEGWKKRVSSERQTKLVADWFEINWKRSCRGKKPNKDPVAGAPKFFAITWMSADEMEDALESGIIYDHDTFVSEPPNVVWKSPVLGKPLVSSCLRNEYELRVDEG